MGRNRQENADENIPPTAVAFRAGVLKNLLSATEDVEPKNLKVEDPAVQVAAKPGGDRDRTARVPATPQPRCPLGPLEEPWSVESRSNHNNDEDAFPVLFSTNARATRKSPGKAVPSLPPASLRRLNLYTQHVAAAVAGRHQKKTENASTSLEKNDLAALPTDSGSERLVKWRLPRISDEELEAERRNAAKAQARSCRLRAQLEFEKSTWAFFPLPEELDRNGTSATPAPSKAQQESEQPVDPTKPAEEPTTESAKPGNSAAEAVAATPGSKFLDFCRLISFPRAGDIEE